MRRSNQTVKRRSILNLGSTANWIRGRWRSSSSSTILADAPVSPPRCAGRQSTCKRRRVSPGNSRVEEIAWSRFLAVLLGSFQQRVRQTSCWSNAKVNLSRSGAIPTRKEFSRSPCFQSFGIGTGDAMWEADEVARNGALSRINFGQRFSWAPLAFLALSVGKILVRGEVALLRIL